ncbi:MAG: hypothetical protein U0359_12920 [Byssovorax sp.]
MPLRIVVSFRGPNVVDLATGQAYLGRALALKKRAEALGATLCAWSASTFSFDLAPDELEEAAALALSAQEGLPPEERFGIGIAEGEMSTVGEGGSLAALSWGLPLVAAVALARDARAGEALLDADLVAEHFANLAELGYSVTIDRDRRVLSPRHPTLLPESTGPGPSSRVPLSTSSPASTVSPASTASPASTSTTLPAPPPGPGNWPSLRPPATMSNGPPSSALRPPPVPAISAPRMHSSPGLPFSSTITAPPAPLAPAASGSPAAAPARPGSIAPPPASARGGRPVSDPEIADQLAELAKRALMQGDLGALEGLIAQLRARGEHGDLVERMTALAALRRGATAEALRRLREAAEAKKDPAQQAKARLAYGVALATAGRNESALLEVLQALARARAAGDTQGERACALFLARLSGAAGHAEAASAWSAVATRKMETSPPI